MLGTDSVANHKDESKLEHNEDSFSYNQSVDAATNGTAHPEGSFLEDEMHGSPKGPDATSARESVPDDSVMTDAPARSPLSPLDKSVAADVDARLAISTHSAADSPISSILSPAPKDDIVMGEAQPEIFPQEPTESTQETAISDVPPATPSEATNNQIAAPSSTAADALQVSPTAPPTADTSMSEPSQPTKVSRERDIDSEDEPVAKRAKVETGADQVEVKTTRTDQMEVDKSAPGSSSLHDKSGEPKNLADPSIDGNTITDYMSRQLRIILAGVKKTKAGLGFRQSVRELWPQLWDEYSGKITQPMDISTMEKKLRGELPKYSTMAEFKSDVELLVSNSVTFNGEQHDVTLSAKSTRDAILTRMAAQSAVEPAKPDKKETTKQHTTRHAEPRSTAQPAPAASPRRPPKPADVPPKPVVDSPAFAIPANSNGVPLIRRDSSKADGRAKRPVKPALPKDLVYDTKRKKKLPPELRFCDEVLTEVRKQKYYDINNPFLYPVDPVALNIPHYHKIVKKPMDLQTMGNKMSAGEYTSAKEFEKDFDLIVKNCKLFNGEEHPVVGQALKLLQLFKKELSRKDDWMAKHAPVATFQSNASPAPKDESDEEEHESEAEPEVDEEQKASQHRLATIQKRLEEEQKKVNEMINTGTSEMADVEIAQSVVAMLQKQLMGERAKLATLQAKKPAKAKPAKPKKSTAAGGNKKAAGGAGGTGAGASKKAGGGRKPPKRKIGVLEKEVIASGIAELDGHVLERAIEIIKKDTGQGENDSGELELDIEQLSDEALVRLYDLVTKAFPNLKADKEKSFAAPPPVDPPAPKPKGVTKTKKNKPMSRMEQERRLQQLTELRAQAGCQASGSQEPMESIEGNGNARASMDPNTNVDSDDEESSEEE